MRRRRPGVASLPRYPATGACASASRRRPETSRTLRGDRCPPTERTPFRYLKEICMKNLLACALVALAAAGCAKDTTKAQIEDRSTAQPSTGTTPPPTTSGTTRPTTSDNIGGNPLTDPNSPLSKRSVYFDF